MQAGARIWQVSILILMDVCLKADARLYGKFFETGFNPYFNGCLS